MLLPGWHGPPPQGVSAPRQGGWISGLVPLPGSHLLTTAHDGSSTAGVGRTQPQPELLPHDSIQGGLSSPVTPQRIVQQFDSKRGEEALYSTSW